VAVEEYALGIGLKELLVAGGGHAKVSVALAAVKVDLQTARRGIVTDPSQQSGFQRDTH
jgi:Glu-tRNA(Gln) amidotransferase subunit E-like FAD-binding protein